MKIGILTFHRAHNYGAVLQCFALQETLKKLGHDVEVIDYRPQYIESAYRLITVRDINKVSIIQYAKFLLRDILLLPIKLIRRRHFQSFLKKKLSMSEKVLGTSIPSDYDIYVVGSDQVWNKNITNGYDDVYFCYFQFEKENKKFISYAASAEDASICNDDLTFFQKRISNFDAISVREDHLVKYLSNVTNARIYKTIDPTLLFDRSFWNQYLPSKVSSRSYIIVYQARYDRKLILKAQNIAKSLNCELIEMSAWTIPLSRMGKKGMQTSPLGFVNYIKNAKLVLSTSFHGTVFSVIYGVPFYYVAMSDGWDTRALTLLADLNLQDRAIKLEYLSIHTINMACDFSQACQHLHVLREDSMNFLLNNIKKSDAY